MSQATKIVYNDIDLGLIRTIKIEQRAKYDPHGVDVLYIENRFTIQSIISELDDTEIPLAPSEPGESPAATVARIRHMLLSPRKRFRYTATTENSGEIVLLEAIGRANQGQVNQDAAGNQVRTHGTEANNGPKPISLDITNVSPRTWVIHYVIDVCVQDCGTNQNFSSNRYEQTHEIDEKGMSKYVRIGKVFVRTDMGSSPDGLRELVTPPCPPGCRRSSLYQLAEDGLSMFYRITDKEFFLGPPPGAVEAQGRFSITSAPPGGVLWAQCDITLTGFKKTPKRQLMEMAVSMALTRMKAGGVNNRPDGNPFIMGGAMNEELFENQVSVQMRAMIGNFGSPQAPGGVERTGSWLFGIVQPGLAATGSLWNALPDSEATQKAKTEEAKRKVQDNKARTESAQGMLDTTIKDFAERFGTNLQWGPKKEDICDQRSIVDTKINGNDQFLVMLAAAMRDPCVADTAFANLSGVNDGTTATGPNENSAIEYGDPVGIMKTSSIGQMTLKTEGHSEMMRAFLRDANSIQGVLANAFGLRDAAGSEGSVNTALNWAAGRLCQLDRSGLGFAGVGSLTVERVEILQDITDHVGVVDDIGWYEQWAVAITHDTSFNQDVLPATVSGYPAVKVSWANPLRTVTFRWSVVKHRVPPDVPLLLADPNAVIVSHTMSLPNLIVMANGTEPSYECRGETTYKILNEQYAEYHYPVPPWLKVPMRKTSGPRFDPNYVLTGGAVGAAQDATINPILADRWLGQSAEPPIAPINP